MDCEPIDLSRFVVDHRDRHLEFLTPSSDGHPRERNSKTLITSGAHCLHKQLWLPILLIGFRSTIQPMLILRHLVHTAKQIKPKGCSHLHTASIDLKQAYDTIDRPHLWDHLHNIRMPTHLVNVIKQKTNVQ